MQRPMTSAEAAVHSATFLIYLCAPSRNRSLSRRSHSSLVRGSPGLGDCPCFKSGAETLRTPKALRATPAFAKAF
jgi:hypothetical protein